MVKQEKMLNNAKHLVLPNSKSLYFWMNCCMLELFSHKIKAEQYFKPNRSEEYWLFSFLFQFYSDGSEIDGSNLRHFLVI